MLGAGKLAPDSQPHREPAATAAAPVFPRPTLAAAPQLSASARLRLQAAGGDLTLYAAVLAVVLVGLRSMGLSLRPLDWPAIGLFLLVFSLLYSMISLAFWGQTPGMAWAGVVARNADREPLSFGQTALRWLGGLLTLLLAGLPALLLIGGKSLADRLSGSTTYALATPRG